MIDKRWIFKTSTLVSDKNTCLELILQHRLINTLQQKEQYFHASLEDLYDSCLINNIDVATDIILDTINTKGKILIYGDYDVDGVTSIALLYNFLSDNFGIIDLSYMVADRLKGGYGLSTSAVEEIISKNIDLLIVVDCGIKDFTALQMAKEACITTIVLDHHEPDEDTQSPATVAIDLKYNDCKYPFCQLSACGVVFKFICNMLKTINKHISDAYKYLDLVGLSTACDVVPLIDENRILMSLGLQQLNNTSNIGLQQLIKVSNISNVTMNDILFKLGPRINAAGRISTAMLAVDLLTTKDESHARELSNELDRLNSKRKKICNDILSCAEKQLSYGTSTTVLYDPSWHRGVIGIVASNCMNIKYCPTIIMTKRNDVVVGSCRSVDNINIYDVLHRCSSLLLRFGGHSLAAGITLKEENVERFKECFDNEVSNLGLRQNSPILTIDFKLDLSVVDQSLCDVLSYCEPYGVGNEQPIFVSEVEDYEYSIQQNYLTMRIKTPGNEFFAMGYGFSDEVIIDKKPFLLAYSIRCIHDNDIILTIEGIKDLTRDVA